MGSQCRPHHTTIVTTGAPKEFRAGGDAAVYVFILLILKILHDFNKLEYHYSQGLGYLGSCRIFSIHRIFCFRQYFEAPSHEVV